MKELQEFFDALPKPKPAATRIDWGRPVNHFEEYSNDWETSPSPEPEHADLCHEMAESPQEPDICESSGHK